MFGMQRIFARISPNLSEKLLCDFCLQMFSHKDHEDLLWCGLQNKGFHLFFCKRLEPFLLRFSEVLPRYLEILPRFSDFAQIFMDFA